MYTLVGFELGLSALQADATTTAGQMVFFFAQQTFEITLQIFQQNNESAVVEETQKVLVDFLCSLQVLIVSSSPKK
jgi:hypothetical protein